MGKIPMDEKTLEKARQAHNEYMRQYRKRNPEKTREMNRRYWAKKAAQMAEEKQKERTDDGEQ